MSKASKPDKANTLVIKREKGQSEADAFAEAGLSAVIHNACTVRGYVRGYVGEIGNIDVVAAIKAMQAKVKKVQSGDLADLEATLMSQAVNLNAMFNELARRATLNMGQNLSATDTYLRLAFKAQSQSRTTLETLAEIKFPKAATFVKQQNNAYQQQVNNSTNDFLNDTRTRAHAHGKTINPTNELLSGETYETLDSGRATTPSAINPALETVGAINRGKN